MAGQAISLQKVSVGGREDNCGLIDDRVDARSVGAPTLSVTAATVTYTQNILGAGVLALPYAFKSAGIVGSSALLLLIFVLSIFSMGILVILANKMQQFSYKGVAENTLGSRVCYVAEAWVLCYALGICISYVCLLGDFLFQLGQHFAFGSWATQEVGMLLAVSCVCWPLSCARSLGALSYTSFFGALAILFAATAAVKRYADGTYDNPETNHPAALNMDTFGQCFPIMAQAFGGHYNIPSLYKEVAPRAGQSDAAADRAGFQRMMKVIVNSLILSTVLYGTVGIVVYLTFGSHTKSDFSNNFASDDGWLVITRLAMTFALCVTFPLSSVAARSSILKLTGWELSARTQVPIATALSGFCLLVAVVSGGDVGVVFSYNGAIFGTPVCYILPTLMYLFMPRPEQNPAWRMFSICCATLGILFGILGVVVVTSNLLKRTPQLTEPSTHASSMTEPFL